MYTYVYTLVYMRAVGLGRFRDGLVQTLCGFRFGVVSSRFRVCPGLGLLLVSGGFKIGFRLV